LTPKQEARLYGRAIKSRWDITDDVKATVLDSLVSIASHGEKESARVAAAKALISAEQQNQIDEHKIVDIGIAKRNAELDEIASDLGIETSLILDAKSEGGPSDQPAKSGTPRKRARARPRKKKATKKQGG
jgi:hypothetical protein